MTQIIKDYSSVQDYTYHVRYNPELLKPQVCQNCGCHHFWQNGYYQRKISGRDQHKSNRDPIDIIRFKCSRCKQTYSIMPSPIALYRWYFWCFQLQVLLLLLQGISVNAVAKQYAISRDTASRWYLWLMHSFEVFHMSLCAGHPYYARFTNDQMILFYQDLLNWRDLSQLALFWHSRDLLVPYQWRHANE